MGLVIENCKGTVHVISDSIFGAGGQGGFYEVRPVIDSPRGSKALLMSAPLDFREIVQPVTTLDDRRILHLFGTAWNEMSVAGLLLLGGRSTKGEILSTLISWYEDNRVSARQKPIRVSLGTAALDAYVVGLGLGNANPVNNTQPFTLSLVTADIQA